jgi:tetratricopeptide (TPR) repeat protein
MAKIRSFTFAWLIGVCTAGSLIQSVLAQDRSLERPFMQTSMPVSPLSASKDDGDNQVADSQDVRIQAIQQRIEILKEMMARKQAAAAAATSPSASHAPPATLTDPAMLAGESSTNDPSPGENRAGAASSTEFENKNKSHSPSAFSNPLEGLEISTSTMNSLELANSLFVTGHYSQALKGYEALLSTESAGLDRDWLRCLAANCQRVLGQFGQAERLYREVVSSKKDSYPGDHSKWYLDHLTRRQQLQAQIQTIDAELESLTRHVQQKGP